MEVGDRRLESVEVVKFFGVMISGDGRLGERIRSRTGKAARVIGVLNEPNLSPDVVWEHATTSGRVPLLPCFQGCHPASR